MGILDLLIDRKLTNLKRAKNNSPSVLQDVNTLASDLKDVETLSNNLGINQGKNKLQVNVLDGPSKNSLLPNLKLSTPGGAAMSTFDLMVKKMQRKQTIKDKILDIIGDN
jgi:hypothetical protein